MAEANPISPTASDVVGAIQRGLSELNTYLSRPALAVDVSLSREHLAHVFDLFDLLNQMQEGMQQGAQNGASAEARTN